MLFNHGMIKSVCLRMLCICLKLRQKCPKTAHVPLISIFFLGWLAFKMFKNACVEACFLAFFLKKVVVSAFSTVINGGFFAGKSVFLQFKEW